MAGRRRKCPVDFTQRADNDLRHLRDHIARDKPKAAEKWLHAIKRRIAALEVFPLMGEVIPEEPEIGLEIRHLIHGNYRIFYLCARGRVTVIRIIHAARRITAEMLGLGQSE